MSPHLSTPRHRQRQRRQRGVLLGIVMVLLAVLFAAGAFALWSMRSENSSAGHDRLSRQLLDCAEQGLAYGKQYFSTTGAQTGLNQYLAANICATGSETSSAGALPCWDSGGPFPTGLTGAAIAHYPGGAPYTQQIKMDIRQANPEFEFTFAIYNDPAEVSVSTDTNSKVIVYSRCTDLQTMQQRAVQALISVTAATSSDYTGQAGRGFRNQGNQNF